MTRPTAKPPARRRGPAPLDDAERALFERAMNGVRPLPARPGAVPATPPARRPDPPAPRAAPPPPAPPPVAPDALPAPVPAHGLDWRTERQLARGRIAPEARLDLHGLTQVEAHRLLTRTVLRGAADGLRCLLVITGKGGLGLGGAPSGPRDGTVQEGRPRGVLRALVPHWLALAPLAPHVLGWRPAAPRDGGTGALYVMLRRARPARHAARTDAD